MDALSNALHAAGTNEAGLALVLAEALTVWHEDQYAITAADLDKWLEPYGEDGQLAGRLLVGWDHDTPGHATITRATLVQGLGRLDGYEIRFWRAQLADRARREGGGPVQAELIETMQAVARLVDQMERLR